MKSHGGLLSTESRRLFFLATSVFMIFYASMTLTFGWFFTDWTSPIAILSFFGFEILFLGTAYDLTEILLCIVLRPRDLARLSLEGVTADAVADPPHQEIPQDADAPDSRHHAGGPQRRNL